jgi:dihydroxy-acid dehydratase
MTQTDPAQQAATHKLNRYSSRLTESKSRGAALAMLYAAGLTEADLTRPQVGIAACWYDGNPCNMHLGELASEVKQGVAGADMVGMRFNTIGVSDGMSMGTEGMSYSLPSRDLIADSIETVMRAQWYDGLIALPGCDKNMPGTLMAMGRLNRPSIMVYGGTIKPGCTRFNGQAQRRDIVSAFQSYGQYLAGSIDEAQRQQIVKNACPGAGACGGMYTANTMAAAIEAMGMSLPYSSSTPAEDRLKYEECHRAGQMMLKCLEQDIQPADVMTRPAFLNAIRTVIVLGGSTNAVLHLIAMARSVGVELTIDDFQQLSDETPLLADFRPSGTFVMEDLHEQGGTPGVLKFLLENDMLEGDCLTITGKTLAENLADAPSLGDGQQIVQPLDKPLKKSGHIQILRGTLAPAGAVAKITGKEGTHFTGPGRVFDSEEDMLAALEKNHIQKGDVIIIRYEGPKGGPGMPEMLTPTSAIVGAGMSQEVALLTDGRFSGGSHGFLVGHVCPEAQEGGPIALVQDGDTVTIDAERNRIDVDVPEEELRRRKESWQAPPYKVQRGTLKKYIKCVTSASEGCVTDE